MEIVRYDAQERVDHPDITAMSFLVLGEFRRQARGLILGPDAGAPAHPNYIIRGFAVEAQAVPDATIRVRLQISGQPLAFAIGAENLTSRIDHGQLIGGDGLDGSLEGNATQTLDFTGQPLATYRVQMRHVYEEGTNDNRAFWDSGLTSEFIGATDTRHQPVVELRFGGVASDEWIDLADVAWGGATVTSGNITDVREFMLEGASPFSAATQAALSIPDFSRATTRGANGINELVPFMRAIARQITDLKGEDANGFDWFGRALRPHDPGATLNAAQTKSLTTIDTVTYTIGDGVTTFGDFNGADGLEDCLQHLEDMGGNIPEHTTIVLKSYNATGFTFNVNTAHTIGDNVSNAKLTIIGRAGGAIDPGGVSVINFDSVPALNSAILMDTGYLELHGVGTTSSAPTNNITLFAATSIRAYNCRFTGREADGATSRPALGCVGDGNEFIDCLIQGRVEITAPPSTSDIRPTRFRGCHVTNGCIELREYNTASSEQSGQLIIEDCRIVMGETHGWGLRGAIEFNNHSNTRISNSIVTFVVDVDAVHGRVVNSEAPQHTVIRECSFSHDVTAGVHAVGAGGNGADGTGWGVYIKGTSADPAYRVHIEGCSLEGAGNIDAGGIFIENPLNGAIEKCTWFAAGNVGTGKYEAIYLTASSAFDANFEIRGNRMHEWSDEDVRAIYVNDLDNILITGNTLRGDGFSGALTGRGTADVCITLDGVMGGLRITDNLIEDWEPNTDLNRCIVYAGTSLLRAVIEGNQFEGNGGYAVDLDGATSANIQGNTISCSTNGRGITCTTAPSTAVIGNVISMGGSARTGIDFGAASLNACMSNRMSVGTINIASGVVYGAADGTSTRQDLNHLT